MHKEDEELLARATKEAANEGLEIDENRDPSLFHKVVRRLIETPPAPTVERGKHAKQRRGRKRQ